MSSTSKIRIWFLMLCEKNTSFRLNPLLPKIAPSQAFLFPQARVAALIDVLSTTSPSRISQNLVIMFAIVSIKTPTI
jgi:hypothetical protein